MEEKHCYACDQWLPLYHYNREYGRWDHLKAACMDCRKITRGIQWPEILENIRERRKNDPQFRATCNLRSRISKALNGHSKSASTKELLGCTYEVFVEHLESKFVNGMSWKNCGLWHMDHIMPCAMFDLLIEEEQRICFHYTNIQPMWGTENTAKHDNVIDLDIKQLIAKKVPRFIIDRVKEKQKAERLSIQTRDEKMHIRMGGEEVAGI